MTRHGLSTLLVLFWLAGLSTSAVSGPASPEPVAEPFAQGPAVSPWLVAATSQVDRGKAVFADHCARCHGMSGQGGDAPRLIGTPNGLGRFQTAQRLFEFISAEMPPDDRGSLKPEEIWDVLAFILDGNQLLPADTILGPDNAANIRLSR